MECIIMIVFLLVGIGWIIEEIKKSTGKKKRNFPKTIHGNSSTSNSPNLSNVYNRQNYHHRGYSDTKTLISQNLPNGYNRQDYYDRGYSDTDIEYWGLDQPGAPNPDAAGFVIADMADGDFDGDIDF